MTLGVHDECEINVIPAPLAGGAGERDKAGTQSTSPREHADPAALPAGMTSQGAYRHANTGCSRSATRVWRPASSSRNW